MEDCVIASEAILYLRSSILNTLPRVPRFPSAFRVGQIQAPARKITEGKIPTCADEFRVSTASGSERSFEKDLLIGPCSLPLAVLTHPHKSKNFEKH